MVSDAKKEFVHRITKDISGSQVIGLLDMENLPAPQLQVMRGTLRRQKVSIVMARKRLLLRALKDSGKKNIECLAEKVQGMPALLLAEENPFVLYDNLQKSKSPAPAKPGQKSPRDIIVRAGPTSFAPGPIISELAAVGIKTKVEQGKLAIIQDTTVAKEGDVISPKLAETLKRLDIRPMEIGLNLVAVWEKGLVFAARQLRIDKAEYANNFTLAAQWAFNLSMEAAYLTSETTESLLQRAFRDSKSLALAQNILTDATAGDLLARAERQARSLQAASGVEVVEKVTERVAEEKGERIKAGKPQGGKPGEDAGSENLQATALPEGAVKEQPVKPASTADIVKAMEEKFGRQGPQRSPEVQVPDVAPGEPRLEGTHPKQGKVSLREAQDLLSQLQKKGTLRE